MNAIRVETFLNGDTLYLPQLKPLFGKSVEIVVTEISQKANDPMGERWKSPLAGTVIKYTDPLEPATSPDEWESNR